MKKLFKTLLTTIPLMIILNACGGGQICKNELYTDTVICDIADRTNISPEAMSQILIVANVTAIEIDAYTADEAKQFILSSIDKLDNLNGVSITYGQVVKYILAKYSGLSPAAQALFIVINPLGTYLDQDEMIDISLKQGDIDLLKQHLTKQLGYVELFNIVS